MTVLIEPDGAWRVAPVKPVCVGPTWAPHPDLFTPSNPIYLLPEHCGIETLGWAAVVWITTWLRDPDNTDADGNPRPWMPTQEQTRFILWWYAVDKTGRFRYRRGVFQRLKGHGKDPLAAALACFELLGPCRFAYWRLSDGSRSETWEPGCSPVSKENLSAYVQVAAVTEWQTGNTMKLFPQMMSKELVKKRRVDLGKTIIHVTGTGRSIEAITGNPDALEGNRPSFVILNEIQNWRSNNNGLAMIEVLEGNVTKSKGAAARMLAICNAYKPALDSAAKRWREAYEAEVSGRAVRTGILYDSLEAPEEARVLPQLVNAQTGEVIPREEQKPSEEQIKEYLRAVILAVRGDAVWLDVENIISSILDVSNTVSESRRKWLNQRVAAEDSWADPSWISRAADPELAEQRANHFSGDALRLGWSKVAPEDPVVMFGDGSKSDDCTGLVGMRLSDGYIFTLGIWRKPAGMTDRGWRAPRAEVDMRVEEVFGRFNVVGFLFDPSHAKDDEDSTPYWNGLCDDWHRRYADRLQYWATRTGDRQHAVLFDMATPTKQSEFVMATMATREEFRLGTIGQHDAHPILVDHLLNAKANPENKFGTAVMKEGRESAKKIDLAVCLIGAAMLRRFVLNKGLEEQQKPANVWYAPVRR